MGTPDSNDWCIMSIHNNIEHVNNSYDVYKLDDKSTFGTKNPTHNPKC